MLECEEYLTKEEHHMFSEVVVMRIFCDPVWMCFDFSHILGYTKVAFNVHCYFNMGNLKIFQSADGGNLNVNRPIQ
jgi:hypothetical protein